MVTEGSTDDPEPAHSTAQPVKGIPPIDELNPDKWDLDKWARSIMECDGTWMALSTEYPTNRILAEQYRAEIEADPSIWDSIIRY